MFIMLERLKITCYNGWLLRFMTRYQQETAAWKQELLHLIQKVQQGDEAGLSQLYDKTVSKVYSLAYRIVQNAQDAEEVTCDVYTQVWKSAGRYDLARGEVMAWLMVICRSRALDCLRRQGQPVVDTSTDLADTTASADRLPDDLLVALQEGFAVTAALASLSEMQRQVIQLAYFRDLSHSEIAEHLSIPLGTVKSHVRRALQVLNKQLAFE